MKRVMGLFLILVLLGMGSVVYGEKVLIGAGATFPYPLYDMWFNVYHKITGVKVNYQPIGSGGGIRQLLNRVVDFGGTDAFMKERELAKAPGRILHIPTCLGAVVITYNLPNNPVLRLTPKVVVDIFLGKIKKWNDRRITELNPNVSLPSIDIVVVHRSDGSGTTFIFSDYLSKVSKKWSKKVGKGKVINWPIGLGAKGNPGVAGLIKQIPGSIGYVELIYAEKNNMPFALIQNKSGRFIKPSLKSISAAGNVNLPDDTRASITDTDAKFGYPISSFTWIIFYQEQCYLSRTKQKALILSRLLWWMIHGAQKYNTQLLYAPLPESAVKKAEHILRTVTYKGNPLIK